MVKEVRKGESLRLSSISNSSAEELTREYDSEGRRREYFVQLLDCDEIKEAGDARRAMIGEN